MLANEVGTGKTLVSGAASLGIEYYRLRGLEVQGTPIKNYPSIMAMPPSLSPPTFILGCIWMLVQT